MRRLRSREGVLLAILVGTALLCTRLGFWQLARLEQRRARNMAIQRQLESAPVPFVPGLPDYQSVSLQGTFLPQYEILLQNRMLDEQPGFHLVSPLQLPEGLVVFVDRGWIPYEVGTRFDLARFQLDSTVQVEGVLQPSQDEPRWSFLADPIPAPGEPPLRTWRVLNIEGLETQVPLPLHNQYVSLTSINRTQDAAPITDFQVDLSNGPHLSYAIQWFSFAAITVVGGILLLRRSRERGG